MGEQVEKELSAIAALVGDGATGAGAVGVLRDLVHGAAEADAVFCLRRVMLGVSQAQVRGIELGERATLARLGCLFANESADTLRSLESMGGDLVQAVELARKIQERGRPVGDNLDLLGIKRGGS